MGVLVCVRLTYLHCTSLQFSTCSHAFIEVFALLQGIASTDHKQSKLYSARESQTHVFEEDMHETLVEAHNGPAFSRRGGGGVHNDTQNSLMQSRRSVGR